MSTSFEYASRGDSLESHWARYKKLRCDDGFEASELELEERVAKTLSDQITLIRQPDTSLPAAAITIPVALSLEPLQNIVRTIRLVAAEARQLPAGSHFEILIWANSRPDQEVDEKFLELIDAFGPFAECPGISLDVFRVTVPHHFGMSHIRSDYMDTLAMKLLERNESTTYPVVWLDADITHVRPRSILTLATEATRLNRFTYCYPAYTATGLNDDSHARAILLNEFIRRKIEIAYDPNVLIWYVNEIGFGMPIGLFLECGGLDLRQKVNETLLLLQRSDSYAKAAPPFRVASARLGISARRHMWWLERTGVAGLRGPVTLSDTVEGATAYTPFLEMVADESHEADSTYEYEPVNRNSMKEFIRWRVNQLDARRGVELGYITEPWISELSSTATSAVDRWFSD